MNHRHVWLMTAVCLLSGCRHFRQAVLQHPITADVTPKSCPDPTVQASEMSSDTAEIEPGEPDPPTVKASNDKPVLNAESQEEAAIKSLLGRTMKKWGTVLQPHQVAVPTKVTVRAVDSYEKSIKEINSGVDASAKLSQKTVKCEGGATFKITSAQKRQESTEVSYVVEPSENEWNYGFAQTMEYCGKLDPAQYEDEDYVTWAVHQVETAYNVSTESEVGGGLNGECKIVGPDGNIGVKVGRTGKGGLEVRHKGWALVYVKTKAKFCADAKSWLRRNCNGGALNDWPACKGSWYAYAK